MSYTTTEGVVRHKGQLQVNSFIVILIDLNAPFLFQINVCDTFLSNCIHPLLI